MLWIVPLLHNIFLNFSWPFCIYTLHWIIDGFWNIFLFSFTVSICKDCALLRFSSLTFWTNFKLKFYHVESNSNSLKLTVMIWVYAQYRRIRAVSLTQHLGNFKISKKKGKRTCVVIVIILWRCNALFGGKKTERKKNVCEELPKEMTVTDLSEYRF